jgi:hypothetical protein
LIRSGVALAPGGGSREPTLVCARLGWSPAFRHLRNFPVRHSFGFIGGAVTGAGQASKASE